MKKIVIVGAGTAGLICAGIVNRFWEDDVQVKVIYNSQSKNIAVGESTTPIVHQALDIFQLRTEDLVNRSNTTVKLGVNFKDWIPGEEYFHGLLETRLLDFNQLVRNDDSSSIHCLLNDIKIKTSNYYQATTTIPGDEFYEYSHSLHIDTQELSKLLFEKLELEDNVEFIDDIVENVNVDGENIASIECKKSGNIDADLFIDASGFNCVLFKHLNPKWVDTSHILPIDRAILQQVPMEFDKNPAYTLSEATDNGWIWRIPLQDRYGTGYMYSSKFTSDEEAREKFNDWLVENFNTELQTDRIIKYNPGYYEDYWIGNCLAVGLSSGFVEPLEATGIHILIKQIYDFVIFNSSLKNLSHNRNFMNSINRELYECVVNFVCLLYDTNRTDSEFWRYMTANKSEWVKLFEEKCKEEYLDISIWGTNQARSVWDYDSYVQVADGLHLLNKESLRDLLEIKPNGQQIVNASENVHEQEVQYREENKNWIDHKRVIEANKY